MDDQKLIMDLAKRYDWGFGFASSETERNEFLEHFALTSWQIGMQLRDSEAGEVILDVSPVLEKKISRSKSIFHESSIDDEVKNSQARNKKGLIGSFTHFID